MCEIRCLDAGIKYLSEKEKHARHTANPLTDLIPTGAVSSITESLFYIYTSLLFFFVRRHVYPRRIHVSRQHK